MDMFGDVDLGRTYSNRTQQARVISENWVAKNGFCLCCSSDRLSRTATNTRARDFVCENCQHGYELKSKCGTFSKTVLDGAYGTMIETIRTRRTPTFLLLEYSESWSIRRLRAIHHSLITEAAIQPRKPLSASARRAGWTGCNILLPAIALHAQITIVDQGLMRERHIAREAFGKLEKLADLAGVNRTWAATILRLVEQMPSAVFSLQNVYAFEAELQVQFPNNRTVRPKIRQQLQFLRDAGLVKFNGGGMYERTS